MHKKWYRLDTAALIFPAVKRRDWSNVFRLSATLSEDIDTDIMQQAVDELAPAFPSFYTSLRSGAFWYYLEHSKEPPRVREDYAYPLAFMSRAETRRCCVRVLCYKNRVAAEFFHVVTDGRGGSVYLASLLSRYISLRYGEEYNETASVLAPGHVPHPEELEDSFLRNSAKAAAARNETAAYRPKGSVEPHGFKHLITGIVDTDALLGLAHSYDCSVTVLLAAVMTQSLIDVQASHVPYRQRKPVRVTLPVDLRRLYGSRTLRNFSLVVNVGVDPRFGEYTLRELCAVTAHQLYAEATPQYMAGQIAANVLPQRIALLRLAPLFLKNIVLDLVYRRVGERGGCINISNLGALSLPEGIAPYVQRMEFIIGTQRSYPNNCSVISFGGRTYINMIRSIKQAQLERRFFSKLVELGLTVDIESNER